jgi:hypothetical protein
MPLPRILSAPARAGGRPALLSKAWWAGRARTAIDLAHRWSWAFIGGPKGCRSDDVAPDDVPGSRSLRRGLSVVEIMVVAALASVILMGASVMMGRTTRQFKKGTDMMNTQVLMDNIVERLRSDIRSLKGLVLDRCDETTFTFLSISKDRELEISYRYDPQSKTLFRTEDGAKQFDFHGARQIESFFFYPYPSKEEFQYLNVAMQLTSDVPGEGTGSRLSLISQFHSTCLEPRTPFGR